MAISEDELILRVRAVGFAQAGAEAKGLRDEVTTLGDSTVAAGEKSKAGFGLFKSGMGGLAAAVGLTGLVFGVKDLVHAGIEYDSQTKQLQATLNGLGIHSKKAFEEVDASATKLSENGGFIRPEELQSITNYLGELHNIPGAQNKITMAEKANLATVELARAKHLQWGQAQMAVARAIAGNTTRLAQYVNYIPQVKNAEAGLRAAFAEKALQMKEQFKALGPGASEAYQQWEIGARKTLALQEQQVIAQDHQITGTVLINGILKQYGKNLHAFNNSTAGIVNNLKNSIGILAGQIGKSLLPYVNIVLKGFRALFSFLNGHKWILEAIAGAAGFAGLLLLLRLTTRGAFWLSKSILTLFANFWKLTTGIFKTKTETKELYDSTKIQQMAFSGLSEEAMVALKGLQGYGTAEVRAAMEAAKLSKAMEENIALLDTWKTQLGVTAATTETDMSVMASSMTVATAAEDDMAVSAGILATAMDAIPGMVLFTALGIGLQLLMTHWKQVSHAIVDGWHWVENAGKNTIHWLAHAWSDVRNAVTGAWHSIVHAVGQAIDWIVKKVEWAMNNTPLGTLFQIGKAGVGFFSNLAQGNIGGAAGSLWGGVKGVASTLTGGLLAHGGVVPKHFAFGGPVGSDTVPAWLTPGEYVLNSALTNQIGVPQLNSWSQGGAQAPAGNFTIVPGQVVMNVDGRQLARAVVRYTLERAARGPSSLVGGGLVTGAGVSVSSRND